jgi:hypothetical protein
MKDLPEVPKPSARIWSTYEMAFSALLVFALVGIVAGLVFAIQDAIIGSGAEDAAQDLESSALSDVGIERLGTIPAVLPELSGLAASSSYPGILLAHNDNPGPARLFALDSTGRVGGNFEVPGTQLLDFEDLALGPCPGSDPNDCLYLADTGDNNQSRESYAVHVVNEPNPEDEGWRPSIAYRLEFVLEGNASRDIEAMTVLPDGAVIVVTKGQHGSADLYSLSPESVVSGGTPNPDGARIAEARFVATLPIDVTDGDYRVTGAATSGDGLQVAIRTGRSVHLFEVGRWDATVGDCDFGPIEPQGEAITFTDANEILLAGESPGGVAAPLLRVRCP